MSVWNSYRSSPELRPSFGSGGWPIERSLFIETQLGPGESALACCSWLQHKTHKGFTQTNDGVMMYHCWVLRWTKVTDSWRSAFSTVWRSTTILFSLDWLCLNDQGRIEKMAFKCSSSSPRHQWVSGDVGKQVQSMHRNNLRKSTVTTVYVMAHACCPWF